VGVADDSGAFCDDFDGAVKAFSRSRFSCEIAAIFDMPSAILEVVGLIHEAGSLFMN